MAESVVLGGGIIGAVRRTASEGRRMRPETAADLHRGGRGGGRRDGARGLEPLGVGRADEQVERRSDRSPERNGGVPARVTENRVKTTMVHVTVGPSPRRRRYSSRRPRPPTPTSDARRGQQHSGRGHRQGQVAAKRGAVDDHHR